MECFNEIMKCAQEIVAFRETSQDFLENNNALADDDVRRFRCKMWSENNFSSEKLAWEILKLKKKKK